MVGGQAETNKITKRACTTCRQSKIKCNSSETFPAPCSNCQRLKKECRSDASFRRKPVRGRLEEVERQLDRIKRAQSHQDDSSLSPPSQGGQQITPNSSIDGSYGISLDTTNPFGLNSIDVGFTQVSPQSLEDYLLSGPEIATLFKKFAIHYIPHFPVLDTRMSINILHQTNPLLFWTIILISSRHQEALSGVYMNLLSKQLVEPIRSLYTIHALLIYCLWPIPSRKQILDSSWNYCGFAVSAAIRMGLHQSDATWEYDFSQFSAQDIEIRRRTWVGCFIVSTYLSSDLGLPNVIGPAMDLDVAMKMNTARDPLALQFEIERQVSRFSTTMSQRGGSLVRSSLIHMFDAELKLMSDQVLAASSQVLEILYLGAKLSLYSFSLLGETAASTEIHHIDPSTKAIWYLGFETAIKLTHLYSSITDPPHYTYPKHHFWILLSSGYYLLKFLSINTNVTPSESELARNSIRLVYSILQSWSVQSLDEPSRIARIISLLANAELQNTLHQFRRLNRRPPLSIVADVMEMTAWLRAKLKKEGKGKEAMSVSELNAAGEGLVTIMEPVLLDDDALWEGLDEWLRSEGDMSGSLLLPYPEEGFGG
ncbi:fungal-specific transcription factor domain-containing protein [Bisporella sp. PMI_857]|nr:fungal-specific transcription factor domain-containing protein [Bisporella sp. PMI_857]